MKDTIKALLIVGGIFPLLFGCSPKAQNTDGTYKSQFEYFATTEGSKIMVGDKQLRFLSYNMPNLLFTEDEMAFREKEAFELPTEFELRDALESIKQMGGQVSRAYCLPVRRQNDVEGIPRYVTAPGEFNERAFQTMDTLLAVANDVGVRLIIPFLNNWQWQGGRPQYADFRGKTADEFWTDPQLISDFKKTIKYAVNRTNTVTGVKYKNDKAILAWETGNELTAPHSWTREITEYIQEQDTNHLVMSGYHAINDRPVRAEAVNNTPSVDIISSHHYETDPADVIENVKRNLKILDGKKPYIMGEFGFLGSTGLKQIMDFVIDHPDIAGAMTWSLRYHRSEGGFYWHSEPLGYGIYKAYHWPGFNSGREYDEDYFVHLMRRKAFEIQGKEVPERPAPDAPQLLPIKDVAHISWRGSTGAGAYDVERAASANGPWEKVGYNVSDAAVQYWPLFHDETARIGQTYYYRVIAKNIAGTSEPSNVVGPVEVNKQAVIDNLDNISHMYHRTDGMTIETDNDRNFKEDMYRLQGTPGDTLIYFVPSKMTGWNVFAYSEDPETTVTLYESPDNVHYTKVQPDTSSYFISGLDYNYWVPTEYSSKQVKPDSRYLMMLFSDTTQISRVEMYYTK